MADARAVVEALLATINDHDCARGRALYADGARLVGASGREMDLDGVDAMLQATFDAFPDLRVEVERWVVDGDTVVSVERMTGTHSGSVGDIAATGRRVELPMVHVTRVTGDRIVERIAYYDTATVVRQLS